MERVLQVENLCTELKAERGMLKAVGGVSFEVCGGEMLGIVGESGYGKGVASQSILRLYDEKSFVRYTSDVQFHDEGSLTLSEKQMESVRGAKISMVFQDALNSLNPVFIVGDQVMEAILIHQKRTKAEAKEQTIEMLNLVGIPDLGRRFHQYPFELSGGMRQRVMIAVALACHPQFLIADEPTTALDVTIQAQIMDLIVDMNKHLGMAVTLITHDLAIVAEMCGRLIVMYLGQIVEEGRVEDIFDHPMHPYTIGLMNSVPKLDTAKATRPYQISGTVPLLNQIPVGYQFAPRCPYVIDLYREEMPELSQASETQGVRCHYENGRNGGSVQERLEYEAGQEETR